MTLLPVSTLGERIAAGPIPIEEALPIAGEIAGASSTPTNAASSIAISSPPTSN